MHTLIHMDQIPEGVRDRISNYVQQLIALAPEQIKTVFVYGSVIGGDFCHKKSDINIGVVVKELGFDLLQKARVLVEKGLRQHIAVPLFFTQEYIKQSLDVFPIEFLNMKEQHVVLYGPDIFEGLVIPAEYLRIFCEQQVKGKLLHIRQAYLERGLQKKGIEAILKGSLHSFIPLFRNLIRLKKEQPPQEKEAVIVRCAELFGFKKEIFLAIYRDTRNDERMGNMHIETVFAQYLEEITQLMEKVDVL